MLGRVPCSSTGKDESKIVRMRNSSGMLRAQSRRCGLYSLKHVFLYHISVRLFAGSKKVAARHPRLIGEEENAWLAAAQEAVSRQLLDLATYRTGIVDAEDSCLTVQRLFV